MAKLQDLILRGTRASQPSAGVAGRVYYVTDENVTERDNGSTWDDITDTSGGGGGGGNATSTGAYGSEPGSPTEGDLYFPTNAPVVERKASSAWENWGPIFRLRKPATSGWSWVNQGSATVDTTDGTIYLTEPGRSSGTNFRCYVRSAPSAPYIVDVNIKSPLINKNYLSYGLMWRESGSGKCVFVYQQYNSNSTFYGPRFGIDKFNSPSSFNAEYQSHLISELFTWLRIEDDNTNRKVSYSVDGQHWHIYHSIGRTDFITADQVGIFVSAENAATPNFDVSAHVLSWYEH